MLKLLHKEITHSYLLGFPIRSSLVRPRRIIFYRSFNQTSKTNPVLYSTFDRFHDAQNKIDIKIINNLPVKKRFSSRPSIASFIEFEIDKNVEIGLILEDDQYLFHPNKYKVLTLKNKVIEITHSAIRFHLNGLIKDDVLFQTYSTDPVKVTQILKTFINESVISIEQNLHLIPMIQSHLSNSSMLTYLNLRDASEIIKAKAIGKPKLECILYGLYLHVQNDPINFLTIESAKGDVLWPLRTESIRNDNSLRFLINSITTSEMLEKALDLSDDELERVNEKLKTDLSEMDDSIEASIYLLGQYLHQQHTKFQKPITKLLQDIIPQNEITPLSVFQHLTKLKIISSPLDVIWYGYQPVEFSPKVDHFKHLRRAHEPIAFGLPSLKSEPIPQELKFSQVAVSLDTSDLNNWELSIHVPDLGSLIAPDDKHVSKLLEGLKDRDRFGTGENLFNLKSLHALSFSELGNQYDTNYALTFVINYDPMKRFETSRLSDVKLTRLSNVKILSFSELNECWKLRHPSVSNIWEFFWKNISNSNDMNRFSNEDVTDFNRVLTMLDHWFFIRNENGSMENDSFKTLTFEEDSNAIDHQSSSSSYLKYVLKEIETLLSHHVLNRNDINTPPLLIQTQNIIDREDMTSQKPSTDEKADRFSNELLIDDKSKEPSSSSVYIKDHVDILSPNVYISPNYEASSFENLVFMKDENGLTPLQNYVIAKQFLKPIEIVTEIVDSNRFASYGLKSGFISLLNPSGDFIDLLNQWQLIFSVQRRFINNKISIKDTDLYEKYDLKELYPKNYKLLTSETLKKYYQAKIEPLSKSQDLIEYWKYRYQVIVHIREKFLANNYHVFKCIILETKDINVNHVKGWCFEMGTQVDILIDFNGLELNLGDQIICSQIISIDEVSLQIVLK